MNKKSLPTDKLQYLLFSEIYHKFQESKNKRKAFSLLESAITCFSRRGFENVTLTMIAREAGVTRPLLRHYFEDYNDIQLISIKYIRLHFQKLALSHMEKAKTTSQSLELYVESCFYWTKNFKTHSKVWLAYLLLCVGSNRHKEINTIAVQTGEERLAALLEKGKSLGEFNFSESSQSTAKVIQTLITGALITVGCEEIPNPEAYLKLIQQECLKIVVSKMESH